MKQFKKVNICRCCGGDNLYRYLKLGRQPLANSYHKGETLEKFPLEVNLCCDCFHSQLSIAVNPELMFKNYLYVSGTTNTFRKHCQSLAKEIMEMVDGSPRVLDIACNDGTLLSIFEGLGAKPFGIDPAENLIDIREGSFPVEVGYWPQDADKGSLQGTFDVITGTNVFAHVDDAKGFLETCAAKLNEDGLIVLEFPYADEMIKNFEFDTIYHEHLSYFTVRSFRTLVERCGLEISYARRTPIHGGSIRFFLRKKHWGLEYIHIRDLINEEKRNKLYHKQSYINFASQVAQTAALLKHMVSDLKEIGKTVVGYGASAKGNTMLNYTGINLDYIVDDNPLKWGFRTPGMDIPIYPPEKLIEREHVYMIILSWNFYEEIKNKVRKLRGSNRTTSILYVPKARFEEI